MTLSPFFISATADAPVLAYPSVQNLMLFPTPESLLPLPALHGLIATESFVGQQQFVLCIAFFYEFK